MTANGKPVRAALYLRKSTVDLRAGDNRSLIDQRHDCERLAEAQGLEIVDIFEEEEGTSASHMTDHARPMWHTAMERMGHTYDVLVAWKMNRCTREGMVEMGTLLDHCEETGGRVVTTDGHDTGGKEYRLIGALISEFDRKTIVEMSEGICRGKEGQRRRGEFPGGFVPYGWVRDHSNPYGVSLDPEAASIIRDMVERYLNGALLHEIADWLNEEGHTTSRGAAWRQTGVAKIFRSHHLVGHRYYRTKGQYFTDDAGHPVEVCPPIITEGQFARVHKLMEKRGRRKRGGKAPLAKPKSLLGQVADCARCGGHLHLSAPKNRSYYRCAVCSPLHQIRADLLEPLVSRSALLFVAALEPGSKILDTVATKMMGRFDPGTLTRREALVDQLDALAGKVAKFRRENLSGALDDDEYDVLMGHAATNKQTLEDELDLLPETTPNLGVLLDLTMAADDPDADLVGPGSVWAGLPHHKQREILRVLIDKVVVTQFEGGKPSENVHFKEHGGRVEITFVTEENVLQFANRSEKVTHRYTKASKAA